MKFRPVYFYLICVICRPLVNFPKIYQCWQSWFLTTFETTINVKCHLKYPQEGAWIAEWSSHSTFDHQNGPGPWGQSLVMTILFWLKHDIYAQLSAKTEWRKLKNNYYYYLLRNCWNLWCLWKCVENYENGE